VDRRAHERSLHDLAPLERARERISLEAGDARPQPDVHRRRVLRLECPHPLERLRQGELLALEQQLAGEQRPVQRPLAEEILRTVRVGCHAAR
jgi:hypothetical protein